MAEWETSTLEAGELRVESHGVKPVIRGYAIVYKRLSEEIPTALGTFREQIAPEAVTRTLAPGGELLALVDHNPEKPLGRLTAGTLRVETDAHGLRVEIDPGHQSYAHDIVESIRRGDVRGMSFAFRTLQDQWDETAKPPIRTVVDMDVREVSVVTFPAYKDTEVAMRSLVAARAHGERRYPRGRTVFERQAWLTATHMGP